MPYIITNYVYALYYYQLRLCLILLPIMFDHTFLQFPHISHIFLNFYKFQIFNLIQKGCVLNIFPHFLLFLKHFIYILWNYSCFINFGNWFMLHIMWLWLITFYTQYIPLKIVGLQIPTEPHRSTRHLQLTARWQHARIMWLALRSVKSNNVDFVLLILLLLLLLLLLLNRWLTTPNGATSVN